MAQHKLGRKEIRQPDAFQLAVQKLIDWLKPYARALALGTTAVLLTLAVVWAVHLQSSKKIEHLNTELTTVIKDYEKNLQAKATAQPTEWPALLSQLEKLYERAKDTQLELIVLHYMANTYIEMGNFDAALGVLADLEKKAQDNKDLFVFVKYAKAKALELKGEQQSALAAYNEAINLTANQLRDFLEEESKRANQPLLPKATLDRFLASKPVTAEEETTSAQE